MYPFREGAEVMSKMARTVFEGEDGEPKVDLYTLTLYVRKCEGVEDPYEMDPFSGEKVSYSHFQL